jgi:O-antigen/teichoic acid export membrane protein
MAAKGGRMLDPGRADQRRWAGWLAILSGIALGAVTGMLILRHLSPHIPGWMGADAAAGVLSLALVVLMVLMVWSAWFRTRGQTYQPQLGIVVSIAVAVALGLTSYGPCAWGALLDQCGRRGLEPVHRSGRVHLDRPGVDGNVSGQLPHRL